MRYRGLMRMKSKEMKNLPELQFPEFLNNPEWEKKTLGGISQILRGGSPRPIESYLTSNTNGLNWLKIGDINKDSKYVVQTQEKVIPTALSKTREVNPGDLILSNSMSFGRPYILKIKACIHDGWIAITKIDQKVDRDFLYYYISSDASQTYFLNNAAGAAVLNLNAEIIKLLPIFTPKIAEQKKITDCLSSIDNLITAQSEKVEALKEHKKALMQQLFPQDGEEVPKLRFPEFKNAPKWKEKKLGDLLDYEQPTKYLVDDTNYDDSFKIPVLTAGKTFILGYSNETHGIFQNPLPVIIFDDFTTATQFVDFSFKAKSSAMKILKPKDDSGNIKIIFELMQTIKYQTSEHKRYWISEYQNIIIKVPLSKEQKKIADFIFSVDNLIDSQTKKVEILKDHKKGLMQQLFPSSEVTK